MAYTYAGRYVEALLKRTTLSVRLLATIPVIVRLTDGTTEAALYTGRTKAVAASNPAVTDDQGNLDIWLDPGSYLGYPVIDGVEQPAFPIQVPIDPAEADAPTAVDVTFTPAGSVTATDVQGAVVEVATDAAVDLAAHDADTSNVHGIADTAALASSASVTAEAAARAAADALLIPLAQKGAANGVATLGADSKLPAAQLPDLAISEFLGTTASQAAMLALTGQRGDYTVRTDTSPNSTWILTTDDPTQLANWRQLSTVTDAVASVNGRTGAVVGLAEATDVALKAPLASPTFTGIPAAPALSVTGLTGSVAASRYVGATASGAPTTGAHLVGDWVIDQTAKVWICTVAGTPGTWVSASATSTAADIVKVPVRVVAASSVLLGTPGATIDGVTMVSGDRFLATANGPDGGIYVWNGAAVPATRATDANTSAAVTTGMTVLATSGNYGGSVWRLTTTGTIVLGTTSLTFSSVPTSPDTAAGSQRYGGGSQATGTEGTAFGNAAKATGNYTVAVGADAQATTSTSIAIGRASRATTTGSGNTALGYGAVSTGGSCTALGGSAQASSSSATAVGQGAQATAGFSTAIGQGAEATAGTFSSPQLAVGYQATSKEGRAVAIGPQARAWGISSTAVGRGAIASGTHSIAIGRGAWNNVANSIALCDGGCDVWFGSGHTHKYDDPIDSATVTKTPSSEVITLHGHDAFDATAAPTNDVAGGPLVLAAGRGTGTAAGGAVSLQVAPAGGVSNNTKNTLVKVVEAAAGAAGGTLGFFAATPVAKPTGVAVTAAGVHAALVSLGLIAA